MPIAVVDINGNIKYVRSKPDPRVPLVSGDRVLPYNPPEVDAELFNMVTIVPVLGNEVEFSITMKPQDEVSAVIAKRKIWVIQNYLDDKAKEYGYDGVLSAASYAGDPNPKFNSEGTAFRSWRGNCWITGYQILEEVQQGAREIPSDQELIDLLPELVITY